MNKTVPSMKNRLAQIVDLSYEILCNKVVSGGITIPNEASLQLHFGVILKQVGQLFEFDQNEHFVIELETPQTALQFQKSGTGKARCDIFITLKKGKKEVSAAIELKHFRYSPNEAVTDNRFFAILDLSNLEQYHKNNSNLLCYEVIYTNNKNYTIRNRSKFEISGLITGTYDYTKERTVTLNNTYNADWDCYDNESHYFLKLGF